MGNHKVVNMAAFRAIVVPGQGLPPVDDDRLAKAGLTLAEVSVERVAARLGRLEAPYLDGLMATSDATKGLGAFLEKRQARWKDR